MRLTKPTVIKPLPVKTPQCCAVVTLPTAQAYLVERYKRLRPEYDPNRCQKPSTVEIDGKHYCRSHAGQIALEKWIVGDLVEAE